MTLTSASQQTSEFQALLEKLYAQNTHGSPLQKIRTNAWDHFLKLGLPSRINDVYKYIPIRHLFAQSYTLPTPTSLKREQIASHIYPECIQSVLVFVNGCYQAELSDTSALPKNLVISTLSEATRTYSALLNNQWTKSLKEETDPFAALNGALYSDGAFLYLPPKNIVEQPIQILQIIDAANAPLLVMPRVHLFVGAQSELSLATSTVVISGSHYFMNQSIEIAIEDDAHVRYLQMACGETAEAWHLDAVRATLKRNSTFKTLSLTNGGATTRNDYRITLNGENAEASLSGLWMLSDKRESHTHVLMDHQAPNCRSLQMYKGVLNDFSRSSFEGKILVHQKAQKTDAFQLNNNLLLSDRAHADSKPNLEIFADDVKASHGATIGQLDTEQLFYMKTRGFSDAEAKNLLVYSYCKELINLIPIPSVLAAMNKRAANYLIKV